MKVQVLITTMNLNDPSILLGKINVQTEFIIGNQSDSVSNTTINYKNNKGLIITRPEKGVGKNRNEAIKYSDADICILSDDDMVFRDGYHDIVTREFANKPEADVLIFNLKEGPTKRRWNYKSFRVNNFNYLNYGAARIAFRRSSIVLNGIDFNEMFGGGCQFSCGEDSMFIRDCLRKGLGVYTTPSYLATLLDDRGSTWFKGYNEKYYYDKGVFFALSHSKLCYFLALYFTLRNPAGEKSIKDLMRIFRYTYNGIRYIKDRNYVKI